MFVHKPLILAAILSGLAAQACSAQDSPRKRAYPMMKREKHVADRDSAPVRGLPFSEGRSFASLDDYLAFLKEAGKFDTPWYREVAPGIYELAGRRGPFAKPERYTRAELAQKFGFSR